MAEVSGLELLLQPSHGRPKSTQQGRVQADEVEHLDYVCAIVKAKGTAEVVIGKEISKRIVHPFFILGLNLLADSAYGQPQKIYVVGSVGQPAAEDTSNSMSSTSGIDNSQRRHSADMAVDP
ncbi:hypothetical protein CRV24_001961 [Beauveria bassiana]|nr:hypothetical protein CRV24_001961 [Beauveria bassiana]